MYLPGSSLMSGLLPTTVWYASVAGDLSYRIMGFAKIRSRYPIVMVGAGAP